MLIYSFEHLHKTAGLLPASIALLAWLPQRFRSFYHDLDDESTIATDIISYR